MSEYQSVAFPKVEPAQTAARAYLTSSEPDARDLERFRRAIARLHVDPNEATEAIERHVEYMANAGYLKREGATQVKGELVAYAVGHEERMREHLFSWLSGLSNGSEELDDRITALVAVMEE